MASGSRELGFPGRSNIKELFSNDETLSAIEDFQLANGILLPSLQPALPLLDLHGVSRLEFHQSVFEEMRECMLTRIKEIASNLDKKDNIQLLNHLLVKSMTVIEDSKLRPVVLCIMQHLPRIEPEHLQVIANNKVFYNEASVEVKQQIWEGDQPLFGDEVSPLLTSYIENKESSLFSTESKDAAFFQIPPKSRRQNEMVQKLVKMVGKKTQLYEMILQFLRTLFLRTHNSHYCTLRSELLMSFHDKDVSDILSIDSCHKFAWCLDACIREKFVDNKRARELQGFLDSIRLSQERVLGDLSMILCDPQAIHTICISVLKNLQTCVLTETNPRSSDDIILLIRMLSMGLKAWQMIDSRVFKEPKLESNWIVRLLPSIGTLMAEDQIASMTGKNSDLDAVPGYLVKVCLEDNLSATLLGHYAIYTAKQGLVGSLIRILPVLSRCHFDTVYSDMILHELVSSLNEMPESFANSDFYAAVIDEFFLPFCSNENVIRHTMRLLWWVHSKINPTTLASLMNHLSSQMQDDVKVKSLYNSLNEKIQNYNQQQLLMHQMAQVTMTGPTMATPSFVTPSYVPFEPKPQTPVPYYDAMPFKSPIP